MKKRTPTSLAAVAFAYALVNALDAAEWQNPSGNITVKLAVTEDHGQSIQQLAIGDHFLPLLGHSGIRRENHGYAWLQNTPPRWLRDRFLIFEDKEGLCIVDSAKKLVLIDLVFTGFAKSATNKWAAVRYRPTSRHQELLSETQRDTFWIIDPEVLAQKSKLSTAENPVGHIPAMQLDHVAVAPPFWTKDGEQVVVPVYSGDGVECVLIDPNPPKERQRVRLNNVKLSPAQALTPWFSTEIETVVTNAIQENRALSDLMAR